MRTEKNLVAAIIAAILFMVFLYCYTGGEAEAEVLDKSFDNPQVIFFEDMGNKYVILFENSTTIIDDEEYVVIKYVMCLTDNYDGKDKYITSFYDDYVQCARYYVKFYRFKNPTVKFNANERTLDIELTLNTEGYLYGTSTLTGCFGSVGLNCGMFFNHLYPGDMERYIIINCTQQITEKYTVKINLNL